MITDESLIKPISGSWFSIYWYDKRHYYWNDACLSYTDEQWDTLIKEFAELGQEYLVMCNVASRGLCVYDSKMLPKINMVSKDPLEAVMTAADKYGVKIFLTNDYYKEDEPTFRIDDINSPEIVKARFTMLAEVAEKYSRHKSFYGWYWAWEAGTEPHFPDYFIKYVNETSGEARKLTPNAKILIAPFSTSSVICDDVFLKQLETLDTDIIAYQDQVGCDCATTDQSRDAFERLRKAHDKVQKQTLWADVETFTWEGIPNRQETPLIPAAFDRLKSQLAAVSPYVDKTLVFIFEGLFSKPGSITYTGYKEAGRYYNEYVAWLKQAHPEMIKTIK